MSIGSKRERVTMYHPETGHKHVTNRRAFEQSYAALGWVEYDESEATIEDGPEGDPGAASAEPAGGVTEARARRARSSGTGGTESGEVLPQG